MSRRLAASTVALILLVEVISTLVALFVGIGCSADATPIQPGSPADGFCDLLEGERGALPAVLLTWILPGVLVVAGASEAYRRQRMSPLLIGSVIALAWVLTSVGLYALLPRS